MRLLIATFIIALHILFSLSAKAEEAIIIGIACYNKGCRIQELEGILSEAYARIGINVTFRYFPPKRLCIEAREKTIDACALVSRREAEINGLVIVEPPLSKASLVAFSTYQGKKILHWKDLRGMTVGTIRGSSLIDDGILDGLGVRRHIFNDARSAFSMLRDGRLDVLLGGAAAASLLAKELEIKVYPSSALSTTSLYHAIGVEHRYLIEKLTTAFGDMVKDGTVRRMLGKYGSMAPEMEPE